MTVEQSPDPRAMREHWNAFGGDDAMYYIATRDEAWTPEAFFASGAPLAAQVIDWLPGSLPRRRLLEVGCGIGRITLHFAAAFDHVDGVDIAPSMIEQAKANDPPANVTYAAVDGASLAAFEDDAFDVVFSALVFQHIPDESVVDAYLHEIARVLAPGGRAVLQFDTRPQSFVNRMLKRLPDAVLPRPHRRYIRRYRRPAEALRARFAHAGLAILDERGARESEHFFLLGIDTA